MLSTWMCSHALGSVCSVFGWGMCLHMHVESLVWSETALGLCEVGIVQPGWKLCNWWRWQSIGCCCFSSQNTHPSQPFPIGKKYLVAADLNVLFCPAIQQQLWECLFELVSATHLWWSWTGGGINVLSTYETPLCFRRLFCAVPPWEFALSACAFLVWTVKCSFTAFSTGLVKLCAARGCLSSSSNLLQIAWLVRLCYLTLWQNTSEVSSFSPGQIHKQVPAFLTCVKSPHVWGNKKKEYLLYWFSAEVAVATHVSPFMAWRKLQPNCDWNCFSYSNTNSDISILFWYRMSFFPFPAMSSQHFSLTFWEVLCKVKIKTSLWALIPL